MFTVIVLTCRHITEFLMYGQCNVIQWVLSQRASSPFDGVIVIYLKHALSAPYDSEHAHAVWM